VVLHGCAIAALLFLPNMGYKAPERPIFEELIQPEAHKIVWYNFSKTKPLPDVNAQQKIGTSPTPRGRELSPQTIIATAPKPISSKQFIWRPVPKIQIRQDLATPNLIARAAAALPAVAPPPPEPPKPKPESQGVKAEQPNLSPATPKGDVNVAQAPQQPIEIPKPRKAFVPPPPKQQARLPLPVQPADVPLPESSVVGSAAVRSTLPEGIGAPTISKGAPPPPNAPVAMDATPGNGKVDVAIATLHPSDKPPSALPDGSRPGQFAKAPAVGEIATGDINGNGAKVPNLTIHDEKKLDAPRVNSNRKTVLYADRVRSISISTLSVPLRPASRTIPRAIEARFQNRNVYTMVVPIENLQPYAGDWIIWFSERQQRPGETPFVRAPVPLRKFETVEPVPAGAHTELRVQFAAIITKDGRLEGVSLFKTMNPTLDQSLLQDLTSWEFKPATRDGVAVDVDIVVEIPFSLPGQVANRITR